MPTHYDVLGVSKSATAEDIRRAYYRQARAWHPDGFVNKSAPEAQKAEEAMRSVNEAFRVLGNDERRTVYDRGLVGSNAPRNGVSMEGGVTRIDARLLDPEYLAARRRRQDDAISVRHSRMMSIIPWLGFLGLVAAIFVFTAYATRTDGPAQPLVPSPDLGVPAGACVRVIQGPTLLEVPCDGINDGRVIGARFPDGFCPAQTRVERALDEEVIVCLQ